MHTNKRSKERKEQLKNKVCKNDYQKAIWDLADKNSCCGSMAEFWMFLNGVDACLELTEKEFNSLKKTK